MSLVETLTLEPDSLRPEDLRSVRAAGISDEAIVDVIYVCGLFNALDRIADSLGFDVPPAAVHRKAARFLLRQGYKLPRFAIR